MGFWSSFKQIFSGESGVAIHSDDEDGFSGAADIGVSVNPATGLPMDSVGALDVAGNPYGVSRDDDIGGAGGGMDFMSHDSFGDSDSF